ncbi:hypothetical protein EY04_27585 [Pseudomonas chlororaphis]|nr:hypothetical protein EY04_27585 [Pseudomonas chlororaphis]
MRPETTVVIIEEASGTAQMKITNSENEPALLVSTIYSLPEDKDPLITLTPPLNRVDAKGSQLVNFFLLNKGEPLKTQRLRRVTFEGLPVTDGQSGARINMSIKQDLPVIINPKGLAKENEPWKYLKWSVEGKQLMVENAGPYVVRLSDKVELLPAARSVSLGQNYLMAQSKKTFALPDTPLGSITIVRIHPSNLYGFSEKSHDFVLNKH